ncbi:hypothetical protein [Sphingobium sp. HDIP04]|uniref:hypothetical protein n=1 Tax=Sphingobium sp. HDIP04 TaxID=428994 RepID=UPI0003876D46|nr:hypothetical protein [Sphingobium sp. HDIP04]EQA97296.1 hypothetical protein L286_23515 [Sphingobium sp. HDIP04]
MSDGGFYLMPRNWQDYPMFGREPFSRRDAWVWLMENAAYTDRSIDVAGKTVAIKRGQLSYSLRFMAKAWDWDEAKVRRFLSRAQKDQFIDARTDAGQTIITICDYDKIQRFGNQTDAPADAGATQERRGSDANNKQGKQGKQTPEPDGSGAAPAQPAASDLFGDRPDDPLPDPQTIMFNAGKKLLSEAGVPPARAGPMLGRWRRDYGAEAVIAALSRAKREGAIEPVSFIEGCLKNGTRNRNSGFGQHSSDFRDPVLSDLAFGQRS